MRRRIGLVVAVAAVIAFTGCSSNAGGSGQGGVLRIGTSSGISSLNPFVGFNQDDYATWMYIYPTLVQYDTTKPTYDFAPNFAQSWELSKDGLKLTFHTTPNATWSDGQPLTADDVVWTIQMIQKYEHGPTGAWANSVNTITSIEAPDDNTVVATYAKPTATALSDVGMTPILPEQVWSQYATGDGKAHQDVCQRARGRPAARRRRPVHPHRVPQERHRAVPAQPELVRHAAAHRRVRAPVLPRRGRDGHRAEDGPARRDQRDPADERRHAEVIGHAGVRGAGARDARLHLQPRSEQARPSRAAQPEGARGVRVRDRPQRDRADRVARATRRPARP